jgi:hypothetical protein
VIRISVSVAGFMLANLVKWKSVRIVPVFVAIVVSGFVMSMFLDAGYAK